MWFWSWFVGRPEKVFAAQALAGLPIMIVKDKSKLLNKNIINHEMIHFFQAMYLGFIFFWIIYLGHFLINLIKYKNGTKAYRNIVFEKEAYDNDQDLEYIFNRKPYAWVAYF